MTNSGLIMQSYFNTKTKNQKDKPEYKKQVRVMLKDHRDANFLTPLTYFISRLEGTEMALLPFMSAEKKLQLLRDLQATQLLLMTQKLYETQRQKTENVNKYNNYITTCRRIIDAIQYEEERKAQKLRVAPDYGYAMDGHPVKYVAMSWGQWFAKEFFGITDSKSKDLFSYMGALNEKRLYWVWGSSLLKVVLDQYFNADAANKAIRTPDPYTGYLSWILYYFRFFVNLGLSLKHVISGPWMSKEEKKTPWTERLSMQWDKRKFVLLNDLLWGTANLLCFFWLVGKGSMGIAGDVLTLMLLIFDIAVTLWSYNEKADEYKKSMLDYSEHIKQLKALLKTPKNDAQSEEDYNKMLAEYTIQLATLKNAKKQCAKDWEYQELTLLNNIVYATGLMIAFTVLITVADATIVGAALCFIFTVGYNAVSKGLEIHKARLAKNDALEEIAEKLLSFKNNSALTEDEKRLLFLEIKQLKAETAYQKQQLMFQSMHLIRSVLFESLLPSALLLSFVYLPVGAAFGILAAILFVTFTTYKLTEILFKAEKESVPEFNEQEFQAFCQDPENWDSKITKNQSFFSTGNNKRAEVKSQPAEDMDEDIDLSFI